MLLIALCIFQLCLQSAMSLVLVALTNIWVMIATLLMTLVFYKMKYIYVSSARCLRRIEALGKYHIKYLKISKNIMYSLLLFSIAGRSSIIGHANATISGLSTIHSSNAEEMLIKEFNMLQDRNSSASFIFKATTRAISFWLEFICVIYMAITLTIFIVFEKGNIEKLNEYKT